MMIIKVLLEPNCSTCKATLTAMRQAAETYTGNEPIEVEAIEDLQEILKYNVWAMPAIIVNDKAVSVGKRLNVKQAAELIANATKPV